jgi:hypothetical protein
MPTWLALAAAHKLTNARAPRSVKLRTRHENEKKWLLAFG